MTVTSDALSRVKRGLAGYVSYLAACEMNSAFSEYVLYEPILRILIAQGYEVQCEYECPGVEHAARGDKKRLDFYARKQGSDFAMEVKWAKDSKLRLENDVAKLRAYIAARPGSRALLCIFGRKSDIKSLNPDIGKHRERGLAMYADFKRTRYGCRIFQLL
jgi:hypothetical protein